MQLKRVSFSSRYSPAAMFLAAMLVIGCATHARTTSVIVENRGAAVEEFEADEFIGTPIIGDYDDNPDLDFILEVVDGDRVFKIDVHEDAGQGNQELIENIRRKINLMEDRNTLRIIGYYSSEFKGQEKEYGFLDLKCIVFYDEETGMEEAYFTDTKDSKFYTEGDVTVVYAPGHHYQTVHYPRYARPWWDTDGDGIPDRYDPWPLSYDTWYDYNLNFIPDWYDPYYIDYYPYWSHWNLSFWAGYNWYTPHYYRHYDPYGYTSVAYYDDYRTYTRLYDRRYVNNNPNRPVDRLDVKTEAFYRGRSGNPRKAPPSSAAGSRYGGYDAPSRPDNRRLVSVNPGSTEMNPEVRNTPLETETSETPPDFNRNRSADYAGTATTRNRNESTRISSTNKRKAPSGGTTDLNTPDLQRRTTAPRAGRDLSRSRSSTTDGRTYKPAASSRNSEVSTGSSGARTSGSRTYRGTADRQRPTSAPADRSRVTTSRSRPTDTKGSSRTISRSRGTSSAPRASSASRSSSRSRPASTTRSAPSRSRSSSPASSTRSAPSRSRSSSPAPSSARSSSSGGSSRSSSQGARSSSSGNRRRR